MVSAGIVSTLFFWGLAASSALVPAPQVARRVHNLPGTSDEFTVRELARRLVDVARREQKTVFENGTEVYMSWTDALLFKQDVSHTVNTNSSVGNPNLGGGVEVTCVSCYISASASAKLSINGDFDLGESIKNVTDQLGEEVKNLTKTTVDAVQAWFGDILEEFWAGDLDFDDLSFDSFHIDNDFDIEIEELPDITLEFTLSQLDVYALIDTTVSSSATLTIPLYKSQSPVGIALGNAIEMGVFVTADLILSASGAVSLRSGFHIRVDEDLGFKLPLFSRDVADVYFNGARYEFLPVTVHSGSVVLKGVLRVGTHAGFSLNVPFLNGRGLDVNAVSGVKEHAERGLHALEEDVSKPNLEKRLFDLNIGAGLSAGVWANLAELTTHITSDTIAADIDSDSDDDNPSEDCHLRIVEEYTLAIGAGAGATVQALSHTWGPQPRTSIPIFYTTLANICAMSVSTTSSTPTEPTPTANVLAPRADNEDEEFKTTTLTTKVPLTATACQDPALLGNCPVSLQMTEERTETKTLVTSWRDGVDPKPSTFPEMTATTKPVPSDFGALVQSIAATSGVPVSYVPPLAEATGFWERSAGGFSAFWNGESSGVSNRVWFGVGVGVGGALLLGGVILLVVYIRRRKYKKLLPVTEGRVVNVGPTEYHGGMWYPGDAMYAKGPQQTVTEAHR